MKSYSRIFGSKFPDKLSSLSGFKDVDSSVGDLIKQYYSFMDSGNIASAAALYEANKDTLKPYYVGMEWLNLIEEELYNTQLFALVSQPTTIADKEPEVDCRSGSAWLKPIA